MLLQASANKSNPVRVQERSTNRGAANFSPEMSQRGAAQLASDIAAMKCFNSVTNEVVSAIDVSYCCASMKAVVYVYSWA